MAEHVAGAGVVSNYLPHQSPDARVFEAFVFSNVDGPGCFATFRLAQLVRGCVSSYGYLGIEMEISPTFLARSNCGLSVVTPKTPNFARRSASTGSFTVHT